MNEKMKERKEVWKAVKGFEGIYEVSNLGNVRGITRCGSHGGNLRKAPTHFGYESVRLYNHPYARGYFVHRLVAEAFIPNPDHKRTVNHIDGNKKNNCVDNLEWATHGENHKHAYRTGLKKVTEKQRKSASATGTKTIRENAKQRYKSVIRIGEDSVERFETVADGAASVNGTPSAIVRCCKHNKPTYKGYRWKYAE